MERRGGGLHMHNWSKRGGRERKEKDRREGKGGVRVVGLFTVFSTYSLQLWKPQTLHGCHGHVPCCTVKSQSLT